MLQPIESSSTGRLRIVHNPKPEPPQVADWLKELFAEPKLDWDIVAPDGRVLESCESERAARQTIGFYGFMFGM